MTQEQATVPGARILVIDDEEVVHASLERILSRKGFSVQTAFSATEGLELLASEPFDLLITDLMMPGMNGIEMLQELTRRGVEVPVVMITGYPTIRTAVQAMRLGARDYVSKPFTRKELLGPVMRALRQEEAAAALEQEPTADAPDPGSLLPGAQVVLAHHSWARFEQDGAFLVGVEQSFLAAVGPLTEVQLPETDVLVEQGTVSVRLTNAEGEEHGVVMPLSGQVVQVNVDAAGEPASVTESTWLLRVLPSHLQEDVKNLRLR